MQQTILLIDDDEDFLQLLKGRCEAIGLRVECARNLLTATMNVSKRPPDIVCADVEMPTGNGLAFCEGLTVDPLTAKTRLVVVSGNNSTATRIACEQLNARYVQKTNNFWAALELILCQFVSEIEINGAESTALRGDCDPLNEAHPNMLEPPIETDSDSHKTKTIVVADDDEDMLQLLTQRISSLGCSVIGVNNALDAINVINRRKPNLVCIDIGMPSGNGLSVCEMMASDQELRKIPTIVLTGRSDGETIRRCHEMLVYYVQKNADTWERIAPLVCELIDLNKPALVT